MLIVSQLCRCTQPLRVAQSRLVLSGSRNGFKTTTLHSRQLITPARNGSNKLGYKGFRLSELVKSNSIFVRFTSSAPKPKTSKVVGYWLLGCSGMVFTAVVLGMVVGYLLLLYSIYYVINVLIRTTNGSK